MKNGKKNNADDQYFHASTALILAAGKRDEDRPYTKLAAMQNWLLGYECPDTIVAICQDGEEENHFKCIIFASKKKVQLLSALAEKPEDIELNLKVEFITRDKKADPKPHLQTILDASGAVVGTLKAELAVDRDAGALLTAWRNLLEDSDKQCVEISTGCALVLAIKDAKEIKLIEGASQLSSKLLRKVLLKPVENALETGENPSHRSISDKAENIMFDPKSLLAMKLPALASDPELIDSCYAPIVQSGRNFDLKPSAVSDDSKLDPGVIILSLGARYQSYCSNISRTYFIDPTPDQTKNYNAVLEAYEAALKAMKPGEKISSVYTNIAKSLETKDLQGLMRNVGFGIGLEFRESYLSMKASNNTVFEEGMVFALRLGVKIATNKNYAILISDTVVIESSGARCLTVAARKFSDVSYDLADSEEEEVVVKDKVKAERMKNSAMARDQGRTRRSARAAATKEVTEKDRQALAARLQHQKELGLKVNINAFKRLTSGDDDSRQIKYKSPADFTSYKSNQSMPRESSKAALVVDRRAMSVLCPIGGYILPLHVSVIKSILKNDNFLRLQLITPVSFIPKDPATQVFKNKQAVFLKEISYRIDDEHRILQLFRHLKELRKQFTDEQMQFRQKQTLVKQPQLILNKSRGARLTDVALRPSLTRGKTNGTLEAHVNGFRFRSDKGGRLDIIYANIKHAFFQPSEKELITVIHFHLRSEIMIGKKKVKDVQFYTEVMEASQDLGSRMQGYDGIEEERRERALRNKINKIFQSFVKKIDEQVPDIEFDIPYRELGFHGAPHKSHVLLQPTVNCLINITESPMFVLTLNEVEFVHFERVHFNNRSFDIVIIHKDYTKNVTVIRSVQRDAIDQIRDWLDSVNLHFTEGAMTFKWALLLKRAREDPQEFFEIEGGWSFLDDSSPGDAEGDSESSSEGVDEFNPDDEELAAEDESFDSEEEFDEDEGEEEEESEGEFEDDEEEKGMSWDELEKKAHREDRKRYREPGSSGLPSKKARY